MKKLNYKLNPELAKIEAPVVLVIDGEELAYENGAALLHLNFKHNYLVEKISARDNMVVVCLKENNEINSMNWVGEEAVSFF